jgi:hypothetical protein
MTIRLLFGAVAILTVALSGCASITGTTNQSVSIQTVEQNGREVREVLCELSNNKGKWFITTPGSSVVTRSNDDMQVLCKKEGLESGQVAVVSAVKGSMFGNIIFGGGIGAIVDHNTGAAYEYPSFFKVLMGVTTRIDSSGVPIPSDATATAMSEPKVEPTVTTSPGALQPVNASVPISNSTAIVQPTVEKIRTKEERLQELKRLYDAGLIERNVYVEQQRKVMESRD